MELQQAIVTALIGAALAAAALGFREWRRLTTFREQLAAFDALLKAIEISVCMAFTIFVGVMISTEAAFVAAISPLAYLAGKHLASSVQHVGNLWWERNIRVGIETNRMTPEEFQRYIEHKPKGAAGDQISE